jgi:amino acid transporter
VTWFEWFGRASLVLVSVAFVLSLVMLVLWQVRMIYRLGRQLDEERRMKRFNHLLPWTDAAVPPPFDWN